MGKDSGAGWEGEYSTPSLSMDSDRSLPKKSCCVPNGGLLLGSVLHLGVESVMRHALPLLIATLCMTGCKERATGNLEIADPGAGHPGLFVLKPEVEPGALSATNRVDVNLGQGPERFIQSLWKQLTGERASAELVKRYKTVLGTKRMPRRIDLAITLAREAGVKPEWIYSDPWTQQVALDPFSGKILRRDIGAVFMFFFTSPDAPNGGPGWANNHVPGMFLPDPLYEFSSGSPHRAKNGWYHPQNAGFWYREMQDARYAGLDFALLNVYGPDLEKGGLEPLRMALQRLKGEYGENVIKLGLFDDTWTWGQPWFGPFWEQQPDCVDAEATARLLYEAKWRPFFNAVPRDHWYLVNKRPMIYFYNSNTLQNRENFHRVLPVMKDLFYREFGVQPWVAVDAAFNFGPAMKQVSESHFEWYTHDHPGKHASERRHNLTLSHCMPRWDPVSRSNSNRERLARDDDLLVKDDRILKLVLNETRDSDILVLATWNDLGEGTGINRCYDYYWDGEWKPPSHFMDLIRRSQAGEIFNLPKQKTSRGASRQ